MSTLTASAADRWLLPPKTTCLLITAVSALVLLAVFVMQYGAGIEPCSMCIWQRWPYAALVVIGLAGWRWQATPMLALALIVLLISLGLAGYHVGVEQGWLALPAGCAAGGDATSVDELRAMLAQARPTCDQVAFKIMGLSLAAWNILMSLALLLLVGLKLVRG